MIFDYSIRYHQTSLLGRTVMETCSVCLMVLDESGICRLCGSEEKVGVDYTNPQDVKSSVDLPFGLRQDMKQEQPPLPFGINHVSSNSAESTPAKSAEYVRSVLPFGVEYSPDSENSQSDSIEADLQKDTLPFGIEDIPSENKQIFTEKPTKSSINPTENLPFGIEHIFDSANE